MSKEKRRSGMEMTDEQMEQVVGGLFVPSTPPPRIVAGNSFDKCDNCGSTQDPVNGKCPHCGRPRAKKIV